jgi:hypothetical protein
MEESGMKGIPVLRKQGGATQLIVDGKLFLILGGELQNSSASSLEYMKPICPKRETGSRAGALFISLEPDEYFITGSSVMVVEFTPNPPGPPIGGLSFIEEGTFVNNEWVPGRRLNGDENSQGRRLRLGEPARIYHVKAYGYR